MEVEDFEAEYDELGEDPEPLHLSMVGKAHKRLSAIRYWQGELEKVESLGRNVRGQKLPVMRFGQRTRRYRSSDVLEFEFEVIERWVMRKFRGRPK